MKYLRVKEMVADKSYTELVPVKTEVICVVNNDLVDEQREIVFEDMIKFSSWLTDGCKNPHVDLGCNSLVELYEKTTYRIDNNKDTRESTRMQPVDEDHCSCYHSEYDTPRCWGTKDSEECSCGGNKNNCDYYTFDENRKAIGHK
jgi:hypothetical protein